jgi:hypothetical protein
MAFCSCPPTALQRQTLPTPFADAEDSPYQAALADDRSRQKKSAAFRQRPELDSRGGSEHLQDFTHGLDAITVEHAHDLLLGQEA